MSEDTLYYEDKPIDICYFDDEKQLRFELKNRGLEHSPDTVAYCDTYGDEIPGKWGCLYLLYKFDLDSTVHECIHLASGIMAQKGHKSLDLTTDHATPLEEQFCALVGNLVGLLSREQS